MGTITENEDNSKEVLLKVIKIEDKLFKPITYYNGDIFLVDSDHNIYNLDNERIGELNFRDHPNLAKNFVDERGFSCELEPGKKIIYIPEFNKKAFKKTEKTEDSLKSQFFLSDTLYFKNGNPNLEGMLSIAEEVFHTQDEIEKNLGLSCVPEPLAVLGRYLTLRYLSNLFGITFNNENEKHIVELSVDMPVKKTKGKHKKCDQYVAIFHKMCSNFREVVRYCGRIWLIGFIKSLNKLSFEGAFKEINVFYNEVRGSNNPLKVIERKGLEHGTYLSVYEYKKNFETFQKEKFHYTDLTSFDQFSLLSEFFEELNGRKIFDFNNVIFKEVLNSRDYACKVKRAIKKEKKNVLKLSKRLSIIKNKASKLVGKHDRRAPERYEKVKKRLQKQGGFEREMIDKEFKLINKGFNDKLDKLVEKEEELIEKLNAELQKMFDKRENEFEKLSNEIENELAILRNSDYVKKMNNCLERVVW